MPNNQQTGKTGEALAVQYFIQHGYRILDKNWRWGNWEIDLVASKNQFIHFIEVKTRTTRKFGFPDDSVTKMKIRFLIDAADEYLYRHPGWKRVQFDILSIELGGKEINYTLIEDVYDW